MKMRTVKQIHAYKVNLATTDKDGSFSCPHCGEKISPDDNSETTYSILETNIDSFDLEEVIIRCNNCTETTHLTGFPKLPEPLDVDTKSPKNSKKDDLWFVAHI